jgi:inorganic pyrophosphatase
LYLSASGITERFSVASRQVQERPAFYLVGEGGVPRSFFHDVPLQVAGGGFSMFAEIGVGDTAKMELIVDLGLNPIMQKVKDGTPKFNPAYPFIHGAFPQTWEDPSHLWLDLYGGDNDPVDCIVVGASMASTGALVQVKVLGVYAMIDGGEMDWKVVAIDMFDPFAAEISDGATLEKYYPGALNVTFGYLSTYKSPPPTFLYDGAFLSSDFAVDLVLAQHELWKTLFTGRASEYDVNLTNTQLGNAFTVCGDAARQIVGRQ